MSDAARWRPQEDTDKMEKLTRFLHDLDCTDKDCPGFYPLEDTYFDKAARKALKILDKQQRRVRNAEEE